MHPEGECATARACDEVGKYGEPLSCCIADPPHHIARSCWLNDPQPPTPENKPCRVVQAPIVDDVLWPRWPVDLRRRGSCERRPVSEKMQCHPRIKFSAPNRRFRLLFHGEGTLMGVSQHATISLEDVAAAAPQCARWFQLYILKDRALTADLLRR